MAAWPDFYPCTCIAVDAQSYGSKNDRRQSEIQHDLPRLLDRAARGAGLDRAQWHIQRKGDEQLAIRPVDGKEPRLVDDYVRHLVAELREYNAQRVPEARMRLRAVVHQGLVELADNGFAGTAVVATARLLNAPALYDALAACPPRPTWRCCCPTTSSGPRWRAGTRPWPLRTSPASPSM
ncbi:hypothetical protein QF034_004395 [Streptomyces africanus]|uniref:Uncharacterized protein n=1 Tax=Streptomyces africanus TaxID=231024 RepID=A0ABU0QUF2_9ACTN|nr:hypothetical protein [Streptomyces africanus]MDQ0750164.1 hypothetical protein [Streptomyces africanus]